MGLSPLRKKDVGDRRDSFLNKSGRKIKNDLQKQAGLEMRQAKKKLNENVHSSG
jgi:hypothetical protein